MKEEEGRKEGGRMNIRRQDKHVVIVVRQILATWTSLVLVWLMLESSTLAQPSLKKFVEGDELPAKEKIENSKGEELVSPKLLVPKDEFGWTPAGS